MGEKFQIPDKNYTFWYRLSSSYLQVCFFFLPIVYVLSFKPRKRIRYVVFLVIYYSIFAGFWSSAFWYFAVVGTSNKNQSPSQSRWFPAIKFRAEIIGYFLYSMDTTYRFVIVSHSWPFIQIGWGTRSVSWWNTTILMICGTFYLRMACFSLVCVQYP